MMARVALSLLLVALLPVFIGSYPLNQSSGKKDRARSLPVVISQYSSVRNSKNNQPAVTIVDPSPVEGSKKIAEQSPDNGKTTSEKLPSVSSSHDTVINSDEDQGHHQKSNKKIDAQEVSGPPKGSPVSDEQTVSSEQSENVNKPSTLSASQQGNPEKMDVVDSLPKEEIVSLTADEKAEGEKPVESAAAAAAANEEKSPAPSSAEPTSDSTQANSEAVATKDTSTSKVTTDDEIGVAVEKGPEDNKPVNNEEKMQDSQITATTPVADEEPSVPAAANKDKSEGTTNNKSVGSKETVNSVESKSEAGNKNKATSADQSISKTEEKESQDSVPAKIDEQVEEKKSSKPVSADEDVKPEPSSKTDDNEDENNQMAPTKTDLIKSDLFEEDRSFKGSLEEFSQFGGKWDQMELSPDRDLDSFNSPEDDLMNESIRAERDDKKTEEKKKKDREEEKEMKEKMSEKEKILGKPFPKTEAKLTKKPIVHSNDPVDEYEITSRKKRSQDAAAGDISKNGEEVESEPEVFSLVPQNHPVVLPNGESTLSDKVKPETLVDDKSGATPAVFSLVPSNFPVVLPNGESTLSDKIPKEFS